MIFPADEHVPPSVDFLRADVVIRILRVPEQTAQAAGLHLAGNNVRPIRRELRVQQHAIVHGHVRGHEDMPCPHDVLLCFDATRVTIVHAGHFRRFVELHAVRVRFLRQRCQVRRRVYPRLSVPPDAAARRERHRHVVDPFNGAARASRRVELIGEPVDTVGAFCVEIARNALETVDTEVMSERLDTIDRFPARSRYQACRALSEVPDDPLIRAIHGLREVTCGVTRFPAADSIALENHYPETRLTQEHRRGQTRHASSDNRDVRVQVAAERLETRCFPDGAPEWSRVVAQGSSSRTGSGPRSHVAESAPDSLSAHGNLSHRHTRGESG